VLKSIEHRNVDGAGQDGKHRQQDDDNQRKSNHFQLRRKRCFAAQLKMAGVGGIGGG
jgi:hypothetical protein